MFVSNSDNLGATLDLKILTHFATTDASFMMECCERTENDKKGGHLAIRNSDKHLILRESAMCADEDEAAFQDITKHKFFNTNNLWIRLDKLKEIVDKFGGFIPLPMIKNDKTVDPKDSSSQKVVQLETNANRTLLTTSLSITSPYLSVIICPSRILAPFPFVWRGLWRHFNTLPYIRRNTIHAPFS